MRWKPLIIGIAVATVAAALWSLQTVSASTDRTPTIVFTSDRDGDYEIFVRAADGTVTKLTRNRHDDHGGVWSPNGRKLAFVSDRDGDPEIFIMNADGTGVTQLTRNTMPGGAPIQDAEPAWSPDGKRIAFTSTRDGGESEIYVMHADGTAQSRLTSTKPYVMNNKPDWSPDGKELVFSSSRAGYENHEIFRMRADGSRVRRITRTASGIDDNTPAWSPNGEEIAFTSNREGTHDVFVMRVDGSGLRKATGDGRLDDVFPRWTSDGKRFVFWTFPVAGGLTRSDVWSVRTDGTERVQLLASTADESSPDPKPGRRG